MGNFSLPNIEYYQCKVSKYRPKSYYSFFPILHISPDGITYELIPFLLNSNGSVLSTPAKEKASEIKAKIEKISLPLKLEGDEYFRFYKKHRDRTMRKPLTRSHKRNSMNLMIYRVKYRMVHNLEAGFASLLDKLGLRKTVRKRFKTFIDKVQKAK